MTPPTYNELVEHLIAVRRRNFRNEPDRDAARLDEVASVLESLLEKLRDEREPL